MGTDGKGAKLGAAKQQAPSAWRLVEVAIAKAESEYSFTFSLRKKKFRQVCNSGTRC